MAIESKTATTEPARARQCDRIAALLVRLVAPVALVLAGCVSVPREPAPPAAPPPAGETAPPAPPAPPPAAPETPSLGLFSRIKTPDTVVPVMRLQGRGVQVFRCEPRDKGFAWVFRLPEADLVDGAGRALVKHGANFSFEHADGSRLLGTVVNFDEAPAANNLRWLLFSTRSFGEGALNGITFVQRVNTVGGMPPARCDARQQSQLLRVDFSAEFVFYKPR